MSAEENKKRFSGKSDFERLGFFSEPGYISIGDPFKEANAIGKRDFVKGRNIMVPSVIAPKSAKQDGYFSKEYIRMFEGEGWIKPMVVANMMRRNDNPSFRQERGWIMPQVTEKNSGKGTATYYATFSGKIPAFSPIVDESRFKKCKPHTMLVSFPKKGVGYGYADIGIGPYISGYHGQGVPEAQAFHEENKKSKSKRLAGEFIPPSSRDYFDPNPYMLKGKRPKGKLYVPPQGKQPSAFPFVSMVKGKLQAGCKAGAFSPFPKHMPDPYIYGAQVTQVPEYEVVNNKGHKFIPAGSSKSIRQQSIIKVNHKRFVNKKSCEAGIKPFALKFWPDEQAKQVELPPKHCSC